MILAIGRLEGKVDTILEQNRTSGGELRRHEQRIAKLEQSRAWILGAAAVVGVLASFASKFII
jgi:hypothetical protein